jgi:hypothetical protein
LRTASEHAVSSKYRDSQGSRRRLHAASPMAATTVKVTRADFFIESMLPPRAPDRG